MTNASEGAAADTAATASTAGTSKVVKAAEQAVKKYAEIIKTATGQEENESSTQQNVSETSITSDTGFMKRAAVIITTVATAVVHIFLRHLCGNSFNNVCCCSSNASYIGNKFCCRRHN